MPHVLRFHEFFYSDQSMFFTHFCLSNQNYVRKIGFVTHNLITNHGTARAILFTFFIHFNFELWSKPCVFKDFTFGQRPHFILPFNISILSKASSVSFGRKTKASSSVDPLRKFVKGKMLIMQLSPKSAFCNSLNQSSSTSRPFRWSRKRLFMTIYQKALFAKKGWKT